MRPFCIATIGGILGIIMGLYFKSIALFVLISLVALFIILIITLKNKKKVIKVFGIFGLSLMLFYVYIMLQENNFYQINCKYHKKEIQIQAIVVSDKTQKEYKDVYEIHVIKVEGKENKQKFKMVLNIKRQKEKDILLEYGDMICFKGIYEEPCVARNEGGFDYNQYLKTKKITGITTVKAEKVEVIEKNKADRIAKMIHDIRKNIVERVRKILPEDSANLCTGLLVGEKTQLSEDIQEAFRKSSLSHMLAISGAHVSYILLGITTLIQKIKLHKRWGKVFLILFFIFFMALTGFTPSVTRSCIMVILQLLASILFRKPDSYQNLAISSFIILLANPYALLDIGFQLSFGGTIGIVVISKKLLKQKEKNTQEKRKATFAIIEKGLKKIKEMCMVTLAANLVIMPIMMYHFHTVSFTFFISNLLASPILGISLILGMIFIVSLFILPLAKLFSLFLQPVLQLLIGIADFSSRLPFSQVLVPTPKIWQIIFYELLLLFFFFGKAKLPQSIMKSRKIIVVILLVLIISPYFLQMFPNNKVTISFIDVGQGDSMLIQTPSSKTILIDGGGSETGSFDVGEKTLIPYLLCKGIMSIDYMIFSHFDSDHCQGLLSVMKKLEVKNVIVSKQGENSNNYTQFLQIAKSKKVKVIVVQAGDKIMIDKQCYLAILFPDAELISTNVLNNNSIVAKLVYQTNQAKEISVLLTGDVEAIAEKKLVEEYQATHLLQADILKVAHHRLKDFFHIRNFN